MAFEWDPKNLERIPEHLRAGMQRYIEHGVRPGDGLLSILTDERLSEVLRACDRETCLALREIYRFLYNCVPGTAQGTKERVCAWMKAGGIAGQS